MENIQETSHILMTLLTQFLLFYQKNKKNKKSIYKIFNIGNAKPIKLKSFVNYIEKIIGKKLKIKYLPMQKGDVEKTH